MNKEVHNYQDKNIKDFTIKDTFYNQKIVSGYFKTYFCQFVSIKGGMVTGKVLSIIPNYNYESVDYEIQVRLKRCYLFGWREGDMIGGRNHDRCHWFQKDGTTS